MNLGPVVQPQPTRRLSFGRRVVAGLQLLAATALLWAWLAVITLV